MQERLLYLDASAIVRMALASPETPALSALIAAWPHRVSSQLSRLEVMRACRRYSTDPRTRERCERTLDPIALVPLDVRIVNAAAELEPPSLRYHEAIHLASAMSLGSLLGAAVIYDESLQTAFVDRGIGVLHPGAGIP